MKIAFCASPDFAIPSLEVLAKKYQVAVFTQPDRVMGKRVTSPAVKKRALELSLPVYQFESISRDDGFAALCDYAPDVIVTCAFGQFLRRNVLELCKYGVINVHASLLPLYRGAAPIQSAILNGDKQTGVSIMRTEYEMDSGDVILCQTVDIGENETAGELFDRLSIIGANALDIALEKIFNGTATFTKQDHEKATFCKKLEKNSGLLDFSKDATTLKNEIRAYNPWPSSFTYLPDGNIFKIHSAHVLSNDYNLKIGEVKVTPQKHVLVGCGKGVLDLDVIQAGGGKKMKASDYINAHDLNGVVLGKIDE